MNKQIDDLMDLIAINVGPTTSAEFSIIRKALEAALKPGGDLCEQICQAIKAADDKSMEGDYMLDSDDCIRIVREQFATAPPAQTPDALKPGEPAHRTDQQIVDQTEELAKFLLSWKYGHKPETTTPMRDAIHPKAEDSWEAACRIQEMLTATDVKNAVGEVECELEAVASIYITPDGQREVDDWRVELPAGRNVLYTAPPAQKQKGLFVDLIAQHPGLAEELKAIDVAPMPTWTPPPRFTEQELIVAYNTQPGTFWEKLRGFETAVRKQFGVNDE